MSESFSGERRAPGYAEKREKASSAKTVTLRWERAAEVPSRAECERLNRDPSSRYEYRWVEK